jgi:predicted GIY-YIG superfamily endonuclease
MSTLYILQLEDDKWYIGKTDDIHKRFEQHKNGKGSEWTRLYKPIKMVETRKITSIHDETNVTKDFMKKYGIDNVRGGAYCQTVLSESIEETIKHELNSSSDKCYVCGIKGHFANNCPKNEEIVYCCEHCDREFDTEFGAIVHERSCKFKKQQYNYSASQSGKCYRCGRAGHYSNNCYAQTHIKGYELY